MESKNSENSLRDRLLVAGIEEISLHGVADFSLRRVAMRCDASCAAPYRHFKNREEFIRAIVAYINRQWHLLFESINRLYAGDARRRIAELCVAYIRFLAAGAHYRTVLTASGEAGLDDGDFDACIEDYFNTTAMPAAERGRRLFAIKALVFGTADMLSNGQLKNDETAFSLVRDTVDSLLP